MNTNWKTLESRVIHATPWLRLRENLVEQPGLPVRKYEVVEFKGGVGVVAIDDQKRFVLVGQFRYPVGRYSWEIPKGAFPTFDKQKQDALEIVKQELKEETGVTAARWERLAVVHTLLGSTNDEVTLFHACELTSGRSEPEPVEDISTRWVALRGFWEMVDRQEVTDATSIAAVGMCARGGLL
jgi:8-oxo-dGTP pyrophosphatase MutT (NUDIX family)